MLIHFLRSNNSLVMNNFGIKNYFRFVNNFFFINFDLKRNKNILKRKNEYTNHIIMPIILIIKYLFVTNFHYCINKS